MQLRDFNAQWSDIAPESLTSAYPMHIVFIQWFKKTIYFRMNAHYIDNSILFYFIILL